MEVSTDDMYDAKAFRGLLEGAEERRRVIQWLGDGAYDSGETFGALEARGVEAVVKPRRNSVPDTASPARGRAVGNSRSWAMRPGRGEGLRSAVGCGDGVLDVQASVWRAQPS